jgi:peptide-methionine (S)-S-oxide reductase
VIFTHSPEQARIAKAKIAELSASGRYRRPIVTTVEDAQPFWRAEEYHQRYFEKNGGSCHVSYAELEHQ